MRSRPTTTKSQDGWREIAVIIVHALLIAVFVRIFFYQPFNIPSGSMQSTLLIGDYLFVSKLSYGYSRYTFPFGANLFNSRIFASQPKRGDVVVFKTPRDNVTDYIKRVIGLPGDQIEMRNGVVWLNGQALPRKRIADFTQPLDEGRERRTTRYEEELPGGVKYTVLDAIQNGPSDNTPPVQVPAGHYFMMGDNRDNSADSRTPKHLDGVGFVPFENLVGRADVIFLSIAIDEPSVTFFDNGSLASKAFMLYQLATFGRGDMVGHLISGGRTDPYVYKPWNWPAGIRWRRIFSIVR